MKRSLAVFLAMLTALLLGACAAREVVEIKENLYLTQVVDIYRNPGDYLGKELHLEGLYVVEEKDGEETAYVRRYGPSCCTPEKGRPGFEILWQGAAPASSQWVEVRGVLEQYRKDGEQRLRLRVKELSAKEEKGASFVTQ